MLRSLAFLMGLGSVISACKFKRIGGSAAGRGNILMLVVDDLNSWIGCLDEGLPGPRAKTPAIDSLAQRGILFRRAYCPAPYCNASRMAVFSGCSPLQSGVYQDEVFWENEERSPTYLEQLKRLGYHTFSAGKVLHGLYDYRGAAFDNQAQAVWLNRQDRSFLWDEREEMPPEPLPEQRPLHGIHEEWGTGRPLSPQLDWGALPDARHQEQPDVLNADAVIRWLQRTPCQPFFIALGLYRPHLPWYVPQAEFDSYPLDRIPLPQVLANDLDDVPPIARQWALNPADHATITGHGQWKQAVQAYLASVSFTDRQVGRVLEALHASPVANNTTVVLWSDNGFHLGEKLHWRKFTLWEEATRVPFILVPPAGHHRGLMPQVVDEPVSLLDVFPTLFDLEGLHHPTGICDGHSLLPLLQDGNRKQHLNNAPLTSWQKGNHSLRWGRWRYTRYWTGDEELYNCEADPHEWHNLVQAPTLEASQERALKRLRAEWQRRSLPAEEKQA
ncbi:Choline-sulfatase [Prochlorococcus sp. MIT 1303]|nr:Choline-sulfatase [Prochlorococcus sp. MIT 1303]